MVKAKIEKPNGTIVQIEGSQEEVQNIIKFVTDDSSPKPLAHRKVNKKGNNLKGQSKSSSIGPTGLITELKSENYFKSKRKLNEIQKKLEEKGFIYATTSLSPALFKLTRRKVLRRIKEKGVWFYVSN